MCVQDWPGLRGREGHLTDSVTFEPDLVLEGGEKGLQERSSRGRKVCPSPGPA